MEKRTLIFALCLFLGLFGVQMMFNRGEPAPAAPKVEVVQQVAVEKPMAVPEQRYVLENGVQQLVFSSRGGALAQVNLLFQDAEHSRSVVKPVAADEELAAHPLLREGTAGSATAFNLVSDYPETAEVQYRVTHQDAHQIVFEATQEGRHVVKRYTLTDQPYVVELDIKVDGEARGLWLTTGVLEAEPQGPSQGKTQLFYRLVHPKGDSVESISTSESKMATVTGVSPQWVGGSNGYFGMLVQPTGAVGAGYRVMPVAQKDAASRFEVKGDKPNHQLLLPLQDGEAHFRIYAGPMDRTTLQQLDSALEESPHFTDALRSEGWLSAISGPIARFLWWFLDLFHTVTHSWAAAIFLVTVVLRLCLYPLNSWTFRSMRKMQLLAPEVKALQERYKKEPKKAQGELMKLYRKNGVNPMGGCLPLVIQMPFLMGMFELLKNAFPLRGAGMIPGWITDLTAPDVLFSWGSPIFLIGSELHLLPIIVGAVMFLQQRLFTKLPKDKSLWTDQQRQQRTMGTLMTAFFIFMFYNFPSGLNLYWFFSMVLGLVQQWYVFRKMSKPVIEVVAKPSSKKLVKVSG
jgi:YidC/Oxa1 family membrane protein insertase